MCVDVALDTFLKYLSAKASSGIPGRAARRVEMQAHETNFMLQMRTSWSSAIDIECYCMVTHKESI